MKKRNKIDFAIKVSWLPCTAFLVLIVVNFHYPYVMPNIYQATVVFFENFDIMAAFKGGNTTDPSNLSNLTK